jgi:hypothetical protein
MKRGFTFISRTLRRPGWKRSTCPTESSAWPRFAAARIASASGMLAASGFSTSQ